MKKWAPLFLSTLLCLSFHNASAGQAINDSDLTGPTDIKSRERKLLRESRLIGKIRVFSLKAPSPLIITHADAEPSILGTLLLTDLNGKAVPGRGVHVFLYGPAGLLSDAKTDAEGHWSLAVPGGASGQAAIRFRLENDRWTIEPSEGQSYEWQAAAIQLPLEGSWDAGTFRLDPAAENGKLGFIHLQLLEAFDFFDRQKVNTDWWTKRLAVVFPAEGAYFSPWDFSLHLSQPESWSINLHEFGHAVMAAGTDSHGGGGAHKIDECYSPGLAWSEGWATFFAAAVHLSPDDPDAKFDPYLVPRRQPIRIENVPENPAVCKGTSSEWRVSAGLWDLYDTHADGLDHFAMSFAQLWGAIQGRSMGSFEDAWEFIKRTIPSAQIPAAEDALRQNTLLPKISAPIFRRRPIAVALPRNARPPIRWDGSMKEIYEASVKAAYTR